MEFFSLFLFCVVFWSVSFVPWHLMEGPHAASTWSPIYGERHSKKALKLLLSLSFGSLNRGSVPSLLYLPKGDLADKKQCVVPPKMRRWAGWLGGRWWSLGAKLYGLVLSHFIYPLLLPGCSVLGCLPPTLYLQKVAVSVELLVFSSPFLTPLSLFLLIFFLVFEVSPSLSCSPSVTSFFFLFCHLSFTLSFFPLLLRLPR